MQNTVETEIKKPRVIYFDLARIIAALMVIMVHISCDYVTNYMPGTSDYLTGHIFDGISRICVPLFVMMAGALFLDEDKEVTLKYMRKKICSILALLFIFSAFYAIKYSVYYPSKNGVKIELDNVLYDFASGHYHLWYLFMTVGLYLAVPFLRCFVKRENKRLVERFLIISLAVQFIPNFLAIFGAFPGFGQLYELPGYISNFGTGFFCGYVAYFVLGWYILNIGFGKKAENALCVLATLSVIAIILIGLYVPSGKGDGTMAAGRAYDNLGLLVFLNALGFTVFLSKLEGLLNKSQRVKTTIVSLSNLTFGVYAIHIIVKVQFQGIFMKMGLSAIWYILAVWTVTSVMSFLITFILSKIPFIKKLVRA